MKMNRKAFLSIVLILLLTGLTGCAQEATEEAPPAGPVAAALAVKGAFDSEMSWTLAELQSMDQINVETTNKEGEAEQNTGVKLFDLLEQASLQDGATSLTFIGSDGYEASVDLAGIEGCTDCIVASQDDGTLDMVLPGMSGKVQVKGVVEIRAE
jgi:hypothetical protein